MNSQSKWDAIRSKITESRCAIVCLQETKRLSFDNMLYLRKFCPRHLDNLLSAPQLVTLVALSQYGIAASLREKCF
jgi:hypothetical protein